MNKYEEIAQALMDTFGNLELNTRIVVGSTDNIRWEDVIDDNATVFGVLMPSGGTTTKVENALMETEYISLFLALPNDAPNSYSDALEKVKSAIANFIRTPVEVENIYYYFGDNGLQANDFRTVRGKQIGVITQNLVCASAGDMLEVAGAIVEIKNATDSTAERLFGFYKYNLNKIKNYDPIDVSGTDEQQNFFRSKSTSLVLDYYKFKSNTLHNKIANDSPYFTISLYDGENYIIQNKKMYLSRYTQEGVKGGYTNCQATFIDGVNE